MVGQEKSIEILVVDKQEEDYFQLLELLNDIQNYKFNTHWISGYEPAMEAVKNKSFDLYFIDYLIGVNTGLDLLRDVAGNLSGPVIFLTGNGDRVTDLKAMQYGASDVFVKSEMHSENLERSIRYALESYNSVRALKESENRYRSVFERSLDMIYITDQFGKFLTVNDSSSRIFGYNREEFRNLNAKDLYLHPSDHKKYMEAILENGNVSNFELELKDKLGLIKYCVISGSLEKSGSNSDVFYHGVIHDISRRKKSERDLLIAEKLSVTGRIVRALAHEVRNPLTNINLAVEQLEEGIFDESQQNLIEIIKRNGVRINDLIGQLLQASRPTEINPVKITVKLLLDDTLTMALDRIHLKGIEVIRDFKAESIEVSVDLVKMKMALLNIIMNSIEAMPESGGQLTFNCYENEDGKCAIHIKDNGSGIPKDDLLHLFEPYFSTKQGGMGLGLSTALTIINSHGGMIEVESKVGEGSEFVVLLKNG